MSDVHDRRRISRPFAEAADLFVGPITGLLPAIVGPDEGSWRVQTREGPVRVQVLVNIGSVWVQPDGVHWRRFGVEPDRTAEDSLVTALLTPRIDGYLGLRAAEGPGWSWLVFEGTTRARTWVTGRLERLLVGDPLGRSGLHTLLGLVAEHLEQAPVDASRAGPHEGMVRLAVPRDR